MLENTHDAFIAMDIDGRVTDWNTKAELTFGWRADEAIGQELGLLIIPEPLRAAHRNGLRHYLATGQSAIVNRIVEMDAMHRSGDLIPVELAIAGVKNEVGYSISAFIRDISERKRAQRDEAERTLALDEARVALQHAQRLEAVGKLTGGVAHDFNNVLQVIGSNAQLLQRDEADPQLREKRLDGILAAVGKGARLSAQLLAFARRQPLQPVVLNVSKQIRALTDLLERALGEHITLRIDAAHHLWNVLADPGQLDNVVINLAINARDAMPDGGALTITLRNQSLAVMPQGAGLHAGDYVSLVVADTGQGMPPEVAGHAFEPFFTTKPVGQGTGLGLSMAYGFVKQSGGDIAITSAPGRGTQIEIWLPRTLAPEATVPARVVARVVGGSETILVVEDDSAVQGAVVDILLGLGYAVLRASDASQALQLLRGGAQVDLLFTDVVMPGSLSSPDLARAAQELLPQLAILFTSGYTRNALETGGRVDEGVELLSKPYDRAQLATRIRQVLERRAPQPQRQAAPPLSVLRILLVEDNDDVRHFTTELLMASGHLVSQAVSAEVALTLLAANRFDLLTTDLGLPGMHGTELARQAVERFGIGRIIFATGDASQLRMRRRAHDAVLIKPYTFDDLQALL